MENTVKKVNDTLTATTSNSNLKLQSPWMITYKKIKALFERDEDLDITPIINLPDGNYGFSIFSKNTPKLKAIEKILKSEFTFGNIKLLVTFAYEENDDNRITASDIKTAFQGNDIFSSVKIAQDLTRTVDITFALFAKEVVQFYNDNIGDFYGNFNGLAADIAKEVFNESDIHYGTDIV